VEEDQRLEGFGWQMTVQLIGISLAIAPLNPSINDSLWNATDENIESICELLNLSPLFSDTQVEAYEVEAAMSSLEILFMSLRSEAPTLEKTKAEDDGGLKSLLPITPKKGRQLNIFRLRKGSRLSKRSSQKRMRKKLDD
jgi:hypothetical protein